MGQLIELLEQLQNEEVQSADEAFRNRNQELAKLSESNFFTRYAIKITVEIEAKELLLEYNQFKQFKKSTDRYYKHPEDLNIPVQAHYHIVGSKSDQEIYAVNVDGTAHHKRNRGFEVPKKQADELRQLGVKIPTSNILEVKQLTLTEDMEDEFFTFFLIFEN